MLAPQAVTSLILSPIVGRMTDKYSSVDWAPSVSP